jgi:hypothetical protein
VATQINKNNRDESSFGTAHKENLTEDQEDVVGKTFDNVVVGESIVTEIPSGAALPNDLNSLVTDQDIQLLDFFAKRVRIASGNLATTDTMTTFSPITVPDGIISIQPYQQKSQGFMGFRGTLVCDLQVNANMFQQGRYGIFFIPYFGQDSSDAALGNWINMHSFTRWQVSQLPHAEIDLSCETQVSFRIPCCTVESAYPLRRLTDSSGSGAWGFLRMFPYSPLVSPTGTTTASYTLWAHWEDVELLGPSVPQSSFSMTTKGKKSIQERELDQAGVGPISGIASGVSSIAKSLSMIPSLSSFMSPVSWAADIAAGTALSFGFSKPESKGEVARVQRHMMPYSHNVDNIDNSFKLSYSSKNEVENYPQFAVVDQDELSFAKFCSIWGYVGSVTWDDTQAKDVVLTTLLVYPHYTGAFTDSGSSVICMTPTSFVAHQFKWWRGSIEFRLKIVKTNLHSGRLALNFVPVDGRFSVPTVDPTTVPTTNRTILDIREGNEVVIQCPYVSTQPYSSRTIAGNGSLLQVAILDPLTRPSSVSSSISIIIETRGGPDMEFASPDIFDYYPYVPSVPQSAWRPDCEISNGTVGGASVKKSEHFSKVMMGEKITSFRSLLKMSCAWDARGSYVPDNGEFNVFGINAVIYGAAGAITTPVGGCDWYSLMGTIFALSRGGVRIKFVPGVDSDTITNDDPIVRNYHNKMQTYILPYVHGDAYVQMLTTLVPTTTWGHHNTVNRFPLLTGDTDITGAYEIEVPAYNRYHSRINGELVFTGAAKFVSLKHFPMFRVIYRSKISNHEQLNLFRSCADDAHFGFFTSIPPFIARPANPAPPG